MLADQSVVRMMSLSSGPDSKMVLQTVGQALPLVSCTRVVPIRSSGNLMKPHAPVFLPSLLRSGNRCCV